MKLHEILEISTPYTRIKRESMNYFLMIPEDIYTPLIRMDINSLCMGHYTLSLHELLTNEAGHEGSCHETTLRIALLEQSIGHIDQTLLRIESRIEKIDTRIDKIDNRLFQIIFLIASSVFGLIISRIFGWI